MTHNDKIHMLLYKSINKECPIEYFLCKTTTYTTYSGSVIAIVLQKMCQLQPLIMELQGGCTIVWSLFIQCNSAINKVNIESIKCYIQYDQSLCFCPSTKIVPIKVKTEPLQCVQIYLCAWNKWQSVGVIESFIHPIWWFILLVTCFISEWMGWMKNSLTHIRLSYWYTM